MSSINGGGLPSVTPEFINKFASLNSLPNPSDIAMWGFDSFTMYWFGFLASILDNKLKDFANKMNFVSEVQQKISDVSTAFENLKAIATWPSPDKAKSLVQSSDISVLARAFYSLVRMQYLLSASYAYRGGYPGYVSVDGHKSIVTGNVIRYTVSSSPVFRYLVTPKGTEVTDPPGVYVKNPMKDTSLANKIKQLLDSLKTPNTSQVSRNKPSKSNNYSHVTPYNGNLIDKLLQGDDFYTKYKAGEVPDPSLFSKPFNSVVSIDYGGARTELQGLTTQYISWQNAKQLFKTTASNSILDTASTESATGVTAAQSISSQTEIELDQFEQIENMYNNIRSQVQQTIARRNLTIIQNMKGN